jgi:hypothetical protein
MDRSVFGHRLESRLSKSLPVVPYSNTRLHESDYFSSIGSTVKLYKLEVQADIANVRSFNLMITNTPWLCATDLGMEMSQSKLRTNLSNESVLIWNCCDVNCSIRIDGRQFACFRLTVVKLCKFNVWSVGGNRTIQRRWARFSDGRTTHDSRLMADERSVHVDCRCCPICCTTPILNKLAKKNILTKNIHVYMF